MKKVIIIAGIISLLFGACSGLKHAVRNDDVYVDPKEEKLERDKLAAIQKQKEEEAEKKRQEELAAQKAKDDANPAYKDPVYNKDDYYDYQYASRLRRFNNPVNGLGYYDNYYTNYYWYNNSPAYYGTSIYSSYNWWGPSYSCGPTFGLGMSYNYGYPNYGYYNPYSYGYNPYYYGYNPYYGYNSYWQGYNNGYGQGYYNGYYGYPPYGGWGYYNSYDANSGYGKVTFAPRTSHGGTNSGRASNPGLNQNAEGYSGKYFQNVLSQQEASPKFIEVARPVKTTNANNYSGVFNSSEGNVQPTEPRTNPYGNNPVNGNNPKNGIGNNGSEMPVNNTVPIKSNPIKTDNENAPKHSPIKTDHPKNNLFDSGVQPAFNGGMSSPSSGGGNSPSPRGGNSGGGMNKPR